MMSISSHPEKMSPQTTRRPTSLHSRELKCFGVLHLTQLILVAMVVQSSVQTGPFPRVQASSTLNLSVSQRASNPDTEHSQTVNQKNEQGENEQNDMIRKMNGLYIGGLSQKFGSKESRSDEGDDSNIVDSGSDMNKSPEKRVEYVLPGGKDTNQMFDDDDDKEEEDEEDNIRSNCYDDEEENEEENAVKGGSGYVTPQQNVIEYVDTPASEDESEDRIDSQHHEDKSEINDSKVYGSSLLRSSPKKESKEYSSPKKEHSNEHAHLGSQDSQDENEQSWYHQLALLSENTKNAHSVINWRLRAEKPTTPDILKGKFKTPERDGSESEEASQYGSQHGSQHDSENEYQQENEQDEETESKITGGHHGQSEEARGQVIEEVGENEMIIDEEEDEKESEAEMTSERETKLKDHGAGLDDINQIESCWDGTQTDQKNRELRIQSREAQCAADEAEQFRALQAMQTRQVVDQYDADEMSEEGANSNDPRCNQEFNQRIDEVHNVNANEGGDTNRVNDVNNHPRMVVTMTRPRVIDQNQRARGNEKLQARRNDIKEIIRSMQKRKASSRPRQSESQIENSDSRDDTEQNRADQDNSSEQNLDFPSLQIEGLEQPASENIVRKVSRREMLGNSVIERGNMTDRDSNQNPADENSNTAGADEKSEWIANMGRSIMERNGPHQNLLRQSTFFKGVSSSSNSKDSSQNHELLFGAAARESDPRSKVDCGILSNLIKPKGNAASNALQTAAAARNNTRRRNKSKRGRRINCTTVSNAISRISGAMEEKIMEQFPACGALFCEGPGVYQQDFGGDTNCLYPINDEVEYPGAGGNILGLQSVGRSAQEAIAICLKWMKTSPDSVDHLPGPKTAQAVIFNSDSSDSD